MAAHMHLDTHKVEKPRNHWMLVTGHPQVTNSTMLDLPPPLEGDTGAQVLAACPPAPQTQ